MKDDDRRKLIFEFGLNPVLAHATLFARNHPDPTPRFHREMITDWHGPAPNVLSLAFRGGAKSTLAEEAIVLEAGLQRTKNCLILGESETRAAERLKAVKNHIEQNEYVQTVFDFGPGDVWTDTKITLSNGVMIQALGRSQSLRGVKHLDARPDLVFMDDLEDKESVATPEARRKTLSWFTSTVMPAVDPKHRMRMAATPLHRDALAPTLARSPAWLAKVYPIIHKDADSNWQALWPERFSVEWALRMWEDMKSLGQGEDFVQEYLCQAEDPASRTFTADMIVVKPQPRSWHAVYAIYDPARTTNKQSATTGKVVCSWVGPKLIVWEASAKKWMPDEIVGICSMSTADIIPLPSGSRKPGSMSGPCSRYGPSRSPAASHSPCALSMRRKESSTSYEGFNPIFERERLSLRLTCPTCGTSYWVSQREPSTPRMPSLTLYDFDSGCQSMKISEPT